MKTYEQILEERLNGTSTELVKVDLDSKALTKAQTVDEALALAKDFTPILNKKLLCSEVGLPEDRREKWLATVDESLHAMQIAPSRRTITEKRLAVLQANRHPTSGARFHQSVLESSVQAGQLMESIFGYEEGKIRLEKKLYKYKKKQEKLEAMAARGDDTFLFEKDLEIQRLRLTKEIMALKGSEQNMQSLREELMEWSDIKTELYQEAMAKGEVWSPDAVDGQVGFQEIPLVLRFFTNYLTLKQNPSEGDISSVLNIEGLCLTGMQDGMKTNKLGLYMSPLSDDQIQVIFEGIYGWKTEIRRIPNFLMIKNLGSGQELIYPTTFEMWENMQKASVQV